MHRDIDEECTYLSCNSEPIIRSQPICQKKNNIIMSNVSDNSTGMYLAASQLLLSGGRKFLKCG